MTKVLVIHTGNPETLFENISPLGKCFYCSLGMDAYRAVYFAANRQVFFEGPLTNAQLNRLEQQGWGVTKIEVDDFTQEIRIEE